MQSYNNGSTITCILCSGNRIAYEFMVDNVQLYRCRDCNFMFLNPASAEGSKYPRVSEGSPGHEGSGNDEFSNDTLTYDTSLRYLEQIKKYSGLSSGTLLEIESNDLNFLKASKEKGFEVTGIVSTAAAAEKANHLLGNECVKAGDPDLVELPEKYYDICILRDRLQCTGDPESLLSRIHALLKPGGLLFLTTPSLDSWSAKMMRQQWIKFNRHNRFYFDNQTVQRVLTKTGFNGIHISPDQKYVSLDLLRQQILKYRVPFYFRLLTWLNAVLPKPLKRVRFSMAISGMSIICRRTERRERPLLSVILPVYNEKKTFSILMDQLLPKKIPGMEKEIILVESNSTDGTKEEVMRYKDAAEVKIITEDRPKGKGHAVRTGLEYATGDFIIIQDGDLEYDLNDYEILLEPLLTGKTPFVLGTRHSKGWKIRKFQESMLADFLNFGHLALVIVMNFLYRQSMTDPFTMYKVFRKDCIFGLQFECNRFNFDVELVCKLLRKGYKPLEIPINYTSRSFSEGKKVKLFKDPPTWIKAILKYRFAKVYSPYIPVSEIKETEKEQVC